MQPPSGHVSFVRPLVAAEARIAIDAKHALLSRPNKRRRKVHHRVSNLANNRQHRLLQFSLKLRLARSEPFAVVVPGQVAQKGKRLRAKVGKCSGGSGRFFRCHGNRSLPNAPAR